MDRVTQAFLLALLAGLATGIGSCIAFFAKATSRRFLSVALGFSAGVMIYISLVQIVPTAAEGLRGALGSPAGGWAAIAGIMVYISFDELLPAAREYGEHHLSIYGLMSGMAVMAASLALFQK